MRSRRTLVFTSIALASVLLFAACERTNIGKILDNPDRYYDKTVNVGGTVRDSYGVPLLGGAYKLDDGTGEIWVISRRGSAPRRGASVGAKGRVFSGVNFGGRSFGTVIEESDRRTK